jgi:GGDEF domain-containing protein
MSTPAHALSSEILAGVYQFCNSSSGLSCSKTYGQIFEKVQLQCYAENSASGCDKFLAKYPQLSDKIRQCDRGNLCKQTKEFIEDSRKACYEGIKKSWKEMAESALKLASNLEKCNNPIDDAWDKLKSNTQMRTQFLKECQNTISCKRDLIKNDPRYNKLTDEQLSKYPAVFLMSQVEDRANFQAGIQRNAPCKNPTAADPEYKNISSDQKIKLDAMMNIASEKFKDWRTSNACYTDTAMAEAKCHFVGQIVDPTMVLGFFLKYAKVVGALAKEGEAARAGVAAEELTSGASKAKAGSAAERRAGGSAFVDAESIYGTRLRTVDIKNLPDSVAVAEYQAADGSKHLMMEKAVKTADGKVSKVVRELPTDKLTGAFDANSPVGHDFLESVMKDSKNGATLAFVDVNNLGYVNKNFAKGTAAGDEYLKNVANAINKATNGEAQLFKLGGDEFGVVIHEKDPKKVQEILDKIMGSVYSKDVHATFREEKIARAAQYKQDGDGTALNNFASYSKEGISMGSSSMGRGESLSDVLYRAEEQAKQMKIQTKTEMNIDTTKYGGSAAVDGKKSNQRYVPSTVAPAAGIDKTTTAADSLKLSDAVGIVGETRESTLYRFDDISIGSYKNANGDSIVRYEQWNANHQKVLSREVVMNQKTGVIDGTFDSGQTVLNKFVSSAGTAGGEKALIRINTENLGKVNYFHNGTEAGDKLLKATSDVIKKQISSSDIPFKMSGSEFVVAVDKATPTQVAALQKKIQEALASDLHVRQVFSDEKKYLQTQIAQSHGDTKKMAQLSSALQQLENLQPSYTIRSAELLPGDTFNSVMTKLKP